METRNLSFRDGQLEKLDKICKGLGVNSSEFFRNIIELFDGIDTECLTVVVFDDKKIVKGGLGKREQNTVLSNNVLNYSMQIKHNAEFGVTVSESVEKRVIKCLSL